MKKLLFALVSLYTLMLAYLYLAQRSFIYFPDFTRPVTIEPNYQLENKGLLLKGWAQNRGKKEAILYFGGNGESVEHNLPKFRELFPEQTVYMLSYRGYGNSEGEPKETGIYSDALALYDEIRSRHKSVSVIGRSLGSAVATYVAANREAEKVVLITPFDSIEKLAQRKFPIFPVALMLKDRYMSVERVGQIESEVLVIYAGNDQVVPYVSTQKLLAGFAPKQIEIVEIEGAGHKSISEFAEYENKLREFFTSELGKTMTQEN